MNQVTKIGVTPNPIAAFVVDHRPLLDTLREHVPDAHFGITSLSEKGPLAVLITSGKPEGRQSIISALVVPGGRYAVLRQFPIVVQAFPSEPNSAATRIPLSPLPARSPA